MAWNKHYIEELGRRLNQRVRRVLPILVERCQSDRITVTAGHLAYVTLLSLVPVIAVTFSILSAFPAFASLRGQVENFVFSNFVPAAGEVVQQYIGEFVGNASKMTAFSIIFLVFVALMLISNVNRTLNHIWRVQKKRRLIISFAIYWMVLTLGPVLIGSSLALTSYIVKLTAFTQEYTPGLSTTLLKIAPFLVSVGAFLILYMVVPNKVVRFKHAISGAFIAALLFELSKKAFAAYVAHFPSYQAIYGALAAVPILFVWVYVSWLVVLFGAECTVSFAETSETENSS